MSSEVLGRSNALLELDVVTTEPSGRNRAEIGLDLAAASSPITSLVFGRSLCWCRRWHEAEDDRQWN